MIRRRLGMRAFGRNQDGATAIEFGFLALPFIFIVIATLEIGLTFTAELSLDSAVDRIGRQIRTGEISGPEITETKFRERLCDNLTALVDCDEIVLDLRCYATYGDIDPSRPSAGERTFDLCGPDEIMALKAYYHWPVYTNLMRSALANNSGFNLASVAAFRTEQF